VLVDRRRGYENDPWTVSAHKGVSDDLLEVVFVFGQRNVLFARLVGERRIVRPEEDDLKC
jgi:hypothetical protein